MQFPSAHLQAILRKKLDGWAALWLALALMTVCLSSIALTVADQVANIDRIGEIGFGDAYILQTALRFQKTGVIYEPPEASKSLPAVSMYSPMLYTLLSVPARLKSWGNPFVGPRLVEILAFLLCVLVTASIAKALIPHPWAWRWSVLLALSIESMRGWILQVRGDFPGILFSLIAIRLLLNRSRWSVLLAGAAAGFATQFKITYVSAMAVGFLWLALQRRWKGAAEFGVAAVASSVGIYFLFAQREPYMLAQMFVLGRGLTDYRGMLGTVVFNLVHEPVLLLGVAALPLVALRRWSRWWLPIGYLAVSFAISALLDLQVGGNINYFFEALFAMVPLAAFGAMQLSRCRFPVAGMFLAGLLVFNYALPNAHSAFLSIRHGRSEAVARNRQMEALQAVFQGNHILSFVPSATVLAPETIISEPYMLSYIERLGRIDLQPFRQRILDREFDIVVTSKDAKSWRGIEHIPPAMHQAIAKAYQPACTFDGWAIHLPRQSPRPGLAEQLSAVGCAAAIPGMTDLAW